MAGKIKFFADERAYVAIIFPSVGPTLFKLIKNINFFFIFIFCKKYKFDKYILIKIFIKKYKQIYFDQL